MRQGLILLMMVLMSGLAFTLLPPVIIVYPDHFPAPAYDFKGSPLDSATVQLGRRLFYDEILSANGTISCASCHSPYNAFAHTDHDLSHGIDDQTGTRNAPALFNLAWATSFHLDGAHHSIELQPLAPISHPAEMGSNIGAVTDRLSEKAGYRRAFENAFGDSLVTGERVLKSLAQFQLTLVSAGAKYDRVQARQDTFNLQEMKGYKLFREHCNACHAEPLFTNGGFARNGLPMDTTLNDFGRMMITSLPEDSLLFKIPSLRNLSYTHPYMHDGRFRKLRQVLKHYASRDVKPIPVSADEQSDIIAFLLTLDDRDFVFDRSHGFVHPVQISEE